MTVLSPVKLVGIIGSSLVLNLMASSVGLAASLTQMDFSFSGLYYTQPNIGETWYRYNQSAQVTASLVYDPTAADLQLPALSRC